MIAALALACVVQAPLSAKDKEEFRALVTAVLSEPDAKRRAESIAHASGFESRASYGELVALVRSGPLVPKGLPEPRVVAGKQEQFERFESVLSGLSFECGGAVYRYAVDVPTSYDASKPVGLLLDPGHGSGAKSEAKEKAGFLAMFRRHADAAGLSDRLVVRTEIVEQIGADGLRGAQPEDDVAAVFDACMRDVVTRFRVDLDRVVVNGLSQTGFWTWYLGRANPSRWCGLVPMSAVTHEVDAYAANFVALPVFALHGSEDPICPVSQPRATIALLQRIGADARYLEIAGAKHEYKVWGEEPAALKAIAAKPRIHAPRHVAFSVETLRQPWCGFVRIDAIEKEGDGHSGTLPTAGVDAEIDGQAVHLFTEGITALTVALGPDDVDLDKPVEITWNGQRVHQGQLDRKLATLLAIAGERCDWIAAGEAQIALHFPASAKGR